MRVAIQLNVPMCPECSELLMHSHTEHKYTCRKCKANYKIIGLGWTDRELMCEKEEIAKTNGNDK